MSVFALLVLVLAVVLLGFVLPTATTASGEKQYVSFDANNVILDPARPGGMPKTGTETECLILTDHPGSAGSCVGWWIKNSEAQWQLPASPTFNESINNTISLRFARPVHAQYTADVTVRISILSASDSPRVVEEYYDFSPQFTSLINYEFRYSTMGTLTLPVPFTLKPSSIISIKIVRGLPNNGVWNVFNVFVNKPTFPMFSDVIPQSINEPAHGTTYNPAHTVSSSDFPRANTVNSLLLAATDVYSIGVGGSYLFRNPGSSSITENIGVGAWSANSFASWIVPTDWVGFAKNHSTPRRVKFIIQYARGYSNKDDPSMKIEIRNVSALDELYGRVPSSTSIRHQVSQPGQYIVPPYTGGWYIDSSKYLVAPGEFDLYPGSTVNLTTNAKTTSNYKFPWNVFGMYAVPVELVNEFTGKTGVVVVPSSPYSPTLAPPGYVSPSSSSSKLQQQYDELVVESEEQQQVIIGLAVAFSITGLVAIVLGFLLYNSYRRNDELLSYKINSIQHRHFQNHHEGDFFDPSFAALPVATATAEQQQSTSNNNNNNRRGQNSIPQQIPTAGIVIAESTARNENNNNLNNHTNQHHFGYQRRNYHADTSTFGNENVLNNSSPHSYHHKKHQQQQ